MNASSVRIATRASALALWQAGHVAELVRRADPGRTVAIVHVSTAGDRNRVDPLTTAGGLGFFTREVQVAVLDGRADVGVHSLKDLPTEPAEGLVLASVPGRASPFDALVLPNGSSPAIVAVGDAGSLDALPQGARIGTGSPRRRAQLLHLRPDLEMRDVRGNVETRIQKLDRGDYEALVLAEAGLTRLNLQSRISAPLRPPAFFWAVGQGALGLECRSDDGALRALLERIAEPAALQAVTAERALLARLRAGCHAPLGVSTGFVGDELTLEGIVLSPDGRERIASAARGPRDAPEAVAAEVADSLLAQGANRLIAAAQE